MIQLFIRNASGQFDITQLAPNIRWSGDYRQCARTLEFGVLTSQTDKGVPPVEVPPGTAVTLLLDGKVLFTGMVVSHQKSTLDSVVEITAYDNGFRLKHVQDSTAVTNQTPEQITVALCKKYGIQTGHIESTGVKISRNFFGVDLYRIIQTAYTLASQKNSRKYHVGFEGERLCVTEKKADESSLLLENGVNLMDSSMTTSVENMVNQVVIYNKNNKPVKTVSNSELMKLYGLMQGYIMQTDGENALEKANELLKDNEVQQKITVNCLGSPGNITGKTAVVHEPHSGVYGLFYIDSDVHEWKNGQYFNKLTLNFKNLMDEQEAGSKPGKG